LGGTSADQQFLSKVLALVEEKMADPAFNVDHLVKELGCSRTFFYKKLKGISGYTPNEFVRTIRMKKAALMLKSGDYTVAETSYDVGISDPNYFSKCFKHHFGESPSEFGRNHKAVT
jgi:AraC-like DNA-binding protein